MRSEGMHASSEERLHLLRGHRIADVHAVDARHARPDPPSEALTPFGVVGGQRDVALLGGVERRNLPCQVVVPRPGAELVDTHRHNH